MAKRGVGERKFTICGVRGFRHEYGACQGIAPVMSERWSEVARIAAGINTGAPQLCYERRQKTFAKSSASGMCHNCVLSTSASVIVKTRIFFSS